MIAAFISVESNWNAQAGSHAGAKGLMQLVPGTASSIARKYGIQYNGASDLFNPATNVALGSALLDYNFKAYGSVRNVAVAYNAGGGRVHLSDSALPKETRSYIVKIPRAYELYQSVYPQFCTNGRPHGSSSAGPTPSGSSSSSENFEDFTLPGNANPTINLNEFWKNWLPQ
jgi:soluble lytic murein transglycosylase